MPRLPAPAPFTDADYEMIAAAVLETARGRWFLSEHARRNRNADTRLVLDAIEKLERLIAQRGEPVEADRFRFDLVEMMNAITRTKSEIAAIRPGRDAASHFDQASTELDAIVGTTEKATSDILSAAERVQEIAWTLREQGVEPSICDLIDAHATEVYTACSFQDLTGQRIRKVIDVLRFLEERINAMIKIWRLDDLEFVPGNVPAPPASLMHGPARPGEGLEQQAVDNLIGNERKQDVVWREGRLQDGRDPRNLGEFDLDDLVVFETAADAHAAAEAGAPATGARPTGEPPSRPEVAGEVAPERPADQDRSELASLSLAERMALFS
jgi:hypothetical protein